MIIPKDAKPQRVMHDRAAAAAPTYTNSKRQKELESAFVTRAIPEEEAAEASGPYMVSRM